MCLAYSDRIAGRVITPCSSIRPLRRHISSGDRVNAPERACASAQTQQTTSPAADVSRFAPGFRARASGSRIPSIVSRTVDRRNDERWEVTMYLRKSLKCFANILSRQWTSVARNCDGCVRGANWWSLMFSSCSAVSLLDVIVLWEYREQYFFGMDGADY